MKYRLTILNTVTILFLLCCIYYTILNYAVLSNGEGWGVVFMIGIFLFASTALIVDLLIQKFIKNRTAKNILSSIFVIVYAYFLYIGS